MCALTALATRCVLCRHGRPQLFWKGEGARIGQGGCHLTATNTSGGGGGGGGGLSPFGPFIQWGGGGGGGMYVKLTFIARVPFSPEKGGGGGHGPPCPHPGDTHDWVYMLCRPCLRGDLATIAYKEVVREPVVREPNDRENVPALAADLSVCGVWQPQATTFLMFE